MEDSTPYVVKRLEADRWVFVPSPTFVFIVVGGFCAGSAFLIYLSALFFRSASRWFGVFLLLV
jgi:hypothetical protein